MSGNPQLESFRLKADFKKHALLFPLNQLLTQSSNQKFIFKN